MRIRVEDALPPAGTVTGVGRVTVTPLGVAPFQPAVRLTLELYPSIEESKIVADCDVFGVRDTTAGEGWVMAELIEKSGATGASTEGVPAIVITISDV